jgi:cystathionine beta-lyase
MNLDDLDPERLRQRRSAKWLHYGPELLPCWVAEMDYAVAPAIRAELQHAIEYDDYGYPAYSREQLVPEAFAERMAQRFAWRVDPGEVLLLTEVVQSLYLSLLALTAPGDGVLVQTPIYPPFLSCVRETQRRLLLSPLVDDGSRFGIDFERLSAQGAEARVLMLCHPHNPTGRVFERAELHQLAELAIEHDWLVLSDEIHADLVHPGRDFLPFASLAPEVARRTITLSSASKAFNIAGLRCAVAHFGTPELRTRFEAFLPAHARGGVGLLAQQATLAAWAGGDDWLSDVKRQLDRQRQRLATQLSQRLPQVKMYLPEATYLAWLDCRGLELEQAPGSFFRQHARVALNDGAAFGPGFDGFVRLNFATSAGILDEILERMVAAVKAR